MADSENPGELQRASEAYLNVARDRLNYLLSQVDCIDNKLTSVIGSATIVLPVTAGLLVRSPKEFGDMPLIVVGLLALATLAYLILFVLFYIGYRPIEWDDRPNMAQWKEEGAVYRGEYEDVLYKWLGDGCIDAYSANYPKVQDKARHLQHSMIALAAEVLFLAAAVLALLLLD